MAGSNPLYGLLAEFETPGQLLQAARQVRDAGYSRWDCHTPFPVHGLDQAMGMRSTRLPWLVAGPNPLDLWPGVRVRLNVLDWRNGCVAIASVKTRCHKNLPLPRNVGNAISEYLQSDRPQPLCRNVFLRHSTPAGNRPQEWLGGPRADRASASPPTLAEAGISHNRPHWG